MHGTRPSIPPPPPSDEIKEKFQRAVQRKSVNDPVLRLFSPLVHYIEMAAYGPLSIEMTSEDEYYQVYGPKLLAQLKHTGIDVEKRTRAVGGLIDPKDSIIGDEPDA